MERVVIIGGGIAGLSVASALARRGRSVTLFERAPELAVRSSARSASIFKVSVAEPINLELALRSREIIDGLAPGYIEEIGGYYPCTDEKERAATISTASTVGVREASPRERPDWLADSTRPAIWSPRDGIMDVPALVTALTDDARGHKADLRCNATVTAMDATASHVSGVVVNGDPHRCDVVVDCAGAWSRTLRFGPMAVIRPVRRTIFLLDADPRSIDRIAWDMDTGVYVRPHPEGVLACACDETDFDAVDDVPTDSTQAVELAKKLSTFAPALAGRPILRAWSGLRPLTPDHRFLVGPDRKVAGLFHVTGFGGHGMTAGPAAGELAARLICGEAVPEVRELDPARFDR